MSKDKLVIISVPFFRIAKSILSDLMLEYLCSRSDVVIVCPFESRDFIDQFSKYSSIKVINWKEPRISFFDQKVMAFSEVMRMNGYWFRYRNRGMGYYSKNQYKNFNKNGADTRKSIFNSLLIFLLSILGSVPKFWKLIASISSKSYVNSVKLPVDFDKYKKVILIQSSSWGLQDRVLAHWAEKRTVHKVLLPYTTDQLIMNGYLIADFDAVCVQGPLEYKYALDFHGVSKTKIYQTGSLWFRVLDNLKTLESIQIQKQSKTIMYAGVSGQYYPREAEFLALESIINAIKEDKNYRGIKLIYRPFILDESERIEILKRFENESIIFYQWPNQLISNVNNVNNVDLKQVLMSDVENLSGIGVLIMSGTTSLGLDVSYISNCGIIGNFTDYNQILKSRNTKVFFQDSGTICLPSCIIVKTNIELVEKVKELISEPKKSIDAGKRVRSDWDYENVDLDLVNILDKAIFEV